LERECAFRVFDQKYVNELLAVEARSPASNSARLIPSILIAPIDGEARAMQDHADRASLGAPELSGGVAVPCSAASVPATA
jgi:hypothetical protein